MRRTNRISATVWLRLVFCNGAAGQKELALKAIDIAFLLCPSGSTISELLVALRKDIENPGGTLIPSPYVIRGKKVDLGFFVSGQVLIAGVTEGRVRTEKIVDDAVDKIAERQLEREAAADFVERLANLSETRIVHAGEGVHLTRVEVDVIFRQNIDDAAREIAAKYGLSRQETLVKVVLPVMSDMHNRLASQSESQSTP